MQPYSFPVRGVLDPLQTARPSLHGLPDRRELPTPRRGNIARRAPTVGGGFLLAARSHDASTVSEPNLLDVVSVVPMTRGFSPPASGLATVCQPPEALEANKAKSCAGFLDWLADGDHIISQRPLLQPLLHE